MNRALTPKETALLEKIKRQGKPMHEKNLTREESALAKELVAQGRLVYTHQNRLALPVWTGMVRGTLQGTTRGYAFVLPDEPGEDLFISEHDLRGARHGDLVLARRDHKRGGRPRGVILKVIARGQSTLLGRFCRKNGKSYLLPLDKRVEQTAIRDVKGARQGDLVLAEMVQYQPALADVKEILGSAQSSRALVDGIVRQAGLPMEFDVAVNQQARSLPQSVGEIPAGYTDMRQDLCITIDGADARDLDDAVSVIRTADGYRLRVYIADVSHYVRSGSALDSAAYERGTSVYFPDYVLPMLPVELSNGICSLNAGADRLALTCTMYLDAEGRVQTYRFEKSIIRVKERCIYEKANVFFANPHPHTPVEHMLLLMEELAQKLYAHRHARGALDFELEEGEIVLDAKGCVQDVRRHERGPANRLIEEFMLAANECAAHLALEADLPFLFRIHEKPDEEDVKDLFGLLDALGIPSPPNRTAITPRLLQRVLTEVADTEYAVVVNRVLLRTMKKARYSEHNRGHFGLASRHYCHFTSPIRRYPDLVVHRAISALLRGEEKMFRPPVAQMAIHLSEREKVAMEAERAVDDLKKAEFMQQHMDETFRGVISGVTEFGFFVELENTCEGLVRIHALEDDKYQYNAKLYRLVGRHSQKIYALGDAVQVQVTGVDLDQRKVEFALVGRT